MMMKNDNNNNNRKGIEKTDIAMLNSCRSGTLQEEEFLSQGNQERNNMDLYN